jgi:hypothetical protein
MAGTRIFETDPDAMPRQQRRAPDYVGRFRSGRLNGRRPESLSEWRVTTADPDVASAVAGMLGGSPQEWDTTGEDGIEVLTNADSVGIVIDGSDSIESRLAHWVNGKLVHECDGVEFLDDERRGTPCGCPSLLAERKHAARNEAGPKPDVRLRFRLADDPDLGEFRFVSSSWDLLRTLHLVENDLDKVGAPANATLALEVVAFTPKSGPMAGRMVSYRKPVISVLGAA